MDAAVNVAVDYVHGAVLPAAGRPRRSDHAPVSLGSELDRHGDERFPAQRWLLAQLREEEEEDIDSFERGIDVIVAGLDALLSADAAPTCARAEDTGPFDRTSGSGPGEFSSYLQVALACRP